MELDRTFYCAQPAVPCTEYTRAELAALIENAPKLSQEGNDNANADLYHSGAVISYNGYEVGKVYHNISATAALEKLQPFLDNPGLRKKCAEITQAFFEACVRDHQAKEAARKKSEQKERQAADKLDQYFK